MLAMSFAAMIVVVWGAYVVAAPLVLVLILDSGWIFARCVGFLSGRPVTPMLSLGFIAATMGVGYANLDVLPTWLTSGPFSPQVVLSLLGGIMIIDLVEARESQMRNRTFAAETNVSSLMDAPTQNQQATPKDRPMTVNGDLLIDLLPTRKPRCP